MLKALAYGCGILALDTVFTREMLNGTEHGLFFTKEEGNLKQLIESVEDLPEIIDAFKLKSRERITKNYTWEKITDQYINLFNKISGKSYSNSSEEPEEILLDEKLSIK